MQKLYVESQLPVGPEAAWAVFESDAFRERLATQTNLSSELLSERDEGPVNIRTLRFTSGRDLPGLAAKALGTKRLAYDQTNRYDASKSRLDWAVHVPSLGDRLKVTGVTTIDPAGSGSRRIVDGTIEVKMRLIGGQIEKVVVGEFEKSMRRAVELAIEMMNEG